MARQRRHQKAVISSAKPASQPRTWGCWPRLRRYPMARPCLICTSLFRDSIDLELSGGARLAAIAAKHECSPDSLRRHKANHLTPAVVAIARQRRADGSAVSVHGRLEQLVIRANKLLTMAEKKGSLVAGSQILSQIRQTLETIGRLTGELNDRPQLNVLNIVADPDWQALRGTILAALADHPEARLAVARALSVPDVIEVGA
jgi:hypothetical protein